jgi:hypothetical protein
METRFHLRRLSSTVWLIGLLVMLMAVAACRRGSPILDPTSRTAQADGTISGTVRGPEGTLPVNDRIVHAVNVDTGALMRGSTNKAGGFTFKVPPGRYRIEVTLLPGESVVTRPEVLDITPGDLEVNADFVLGPNKLSRPRPLRMDDGLGAPSA